jgi:hypothetical protein
MKKRIKELISQEKGGSPATKRSPDPTKRSCRQVHQQGEDADRQAAQSSALGAVEQSTTLDRLHACSDCDAPRSTWFHKLHGPSQRRNFCSSCRNDRLRMHRDNPDLPLEHFCFQCGQAQTNASPGTERRLKANLCEECRFYAQSRQSAVVSDGGDENVSIKDPKPYSLYLDAFRLTSLSSPPWRPQWTRNWIPAFWLTLTSLTPRLRRELTNIISGYSVIAMARQRTWMRPMTAGSRTPKALLLAAKETVKVHQSIGALHVAQSRVTQLVRGRRSGVKPKLV